MLLAVSIREMSSCALINLKSNKSFILFVKVNSIPHTCRTDVRQVLCFCRVWAGGDHRDGTGLCSKLHHRQCLVGPGRRIGGSGHSRFGKPHSLLKSIDINLSEIRRGWTFWIYLAKINANIYNMKKTKWKVFECQPPKKRLACNIQTCRLMESGWSREERALLCSGDTYCVLCISVWYILCISVVL